MPGTKLPPERTPLVGRRAEVAKLARLIERSRFVTVLGPAGAGKTRLAQRVARIRVARPAGPRGAWWCDLTPARSLTDVLGAVGAALGVALAEGASDERALSQLGHAIAARGRVLIVLDNFEQVIAAAAGAVDAWTIAAPQARILVTSRERLGLDGEATLTLGPLPERTAIALFVQRARLVDPRFVATGAAAPILREIVQRLDGNPLAIELAAARVDVLPPGKLLERFSSHLDLLRASRQDAPAKHASLRIALDGSWDLLVPWEREALAQCSVFRGGFSLEAAEAVLSPSGARPGTAALDVLQALLAKSLLRREPGDAASEPRFFLYESIREYASEKLAVSESLERTLVRHASHYALESVRWAQDTEGPHGEAALQRITLESDNIFGAFAWFASHEPDRAAQLVLRLETVFSHSKPSGSYVALLDAALASQLQSPELRILLYLARGNAWRLQERYQEAKSDLSRALAEAERLGADELAARALESLARIGFARGELVEARVLAERAIARVGGRETERTRGLALITLAWIHHAAGELDQALAHCTEALPILRRDAPLVEQARIMNVLGVLHVEAGRYDEAIECYSNARDIDRRLSHALGVVYVLGNLANLYGNREAHGRATECVQEAARIARDMGYRRALGLAPRQLGGPGPRSRRSDQRARALCGGDRSRPRDGQSTIRRVCAPVPWSSRDGSGAAGRRGLHALGGPGHRPRIAARRAGGPGAAALGRSGDTARSIRRRQGRARGGPFVEGARDSPRGGLAARPVRSLPRLTVAEAGLPEGRAAVAAAIETAKRTVARAAEVAARSAHVRIATRITARRIAHSEQLLASTAGTAAGRVLVVGKNARWFSVDNGARVDLSRRGALRGALACLIGLSGGRAATVDDLFQAGWPGARIQPESAAQRVYTLVGQLRDLGLRDVLLRRDDGYVLREDFQVSILQA